MFEVKSCSTPGSVLGVEGGDKPAAICDPRDGLPASDGAKGLEERAGCGVWPISVGGARPLPLPKILPPPSFRDAMEKARRQLPGRQQPIALSQSGFGLEPGSVNRSTTSAGAVGSRGSEEGRSRGRCRGVETRNEE